MILWHTFSWMVQLADEQGLKKTDRVGGLLFDEMAIQEDLVVTHKGESSFFTGQIDLGEHANEIRIQRKGKNIEKFYYFSSNIVQI